MKRVLMLAYFFPPSKAAGTFRTLRFVRELPSHGWNPTVLSVCSRTYPEGELDPGLLEKVPHTIPVQRTWAPPYHRWYKSLVQWCKGSRTQASGTTTEPNRKYGVMAKRPGLLKRLDDLAYLASRTPDIDAGWYPFALACGLGRVLREQPDVVYATGGPWTSFLVATHLAKLTGLPLVLDYRDPWTHNPAVVRSGNRFENLAHRLEGTAVRQAACIVANTDVLRETLAHAHGSEIAAKTVVIHNSYDENDFSSAAPPRDDVFTLSYVGSMYGAHSPEPFLHGLKTFLATKPECRGRFRVRLVGTGAPRVASQTRALGLEDVVQVHDPVPHAEALRLVRSSHALLLLLTVPSERSTFVPGKLFEYVAARRPIFAVTRGGALENLLRSRSLTPWIYHPDDATGMAHGLEDLLDRNERDALPQISEQTVQGFSGTEAARALALVLEAARTGAPPKTSDLATPPRPEPVLVGGERS